MIIRTLPITYREFSSLLGVDYYIWPFVKGHKDPIPDLIKNIPRFTQPYDYKQHNPITQDIYVTAKSHNLKDIAESIDCFFNSNEFKELVKSGPKTFWVPDLSGQIAGLTQELYDGVVDEYMTESGGNYAVIITKNEIFDDEFWI